MKKKEVRFMLFHCRCWALITAILLFTLAAQAAVSTAKGAIDEASRQGQFLFLTFYDTENSALTALSTTIADFRKSIAKKTAVYNARIGDPNEKETVDLYKVWRARFPLLLVIAPNGVITGGFQLAATNDQLKQSLDVSELNLKILKQLQEERWCWCPCRIIRLNSISSLRKQSMNSLRINSSNSLPDPSSPTLPRRTARSFLNR